MWMCGEASLCLAHKSGKPGWSCFLYAFIRVKIVLNVGSFELIKVLSKLMPYYVYVIPCRHHERPDPADMQQPDGEQQPHLQCKYQGYSYIYIYIYAGKLLPESAAMASGACSWLPEDYKECSTLFSALPNAHQRNTTDRVWVWRWQL